MKKLFVNKKFYLENIDLFFKWIKDPLLIDKNLKKINLIKIKKNIIKLINKKLINFMIVDNIRIGLVLTINKKKFYYINPFAYIYSYLNVKDLTKLGIIDRNKNLYNKKHLEEIKCQKTDKDQKIDVKRILILGPKKRNIKIVKFLNSKKYETIITNEKIKLNFIIKNNIQYIIASGYPYRVDSNIIDYIKPKLINLHATFLPWGKGIGTTFVSFLLFQPTGVSIHHISRKYDQGNIICRYLIKPKKNDTTRTFYVKLLAKLEEIFIKNYKNIIKNNLKSIKQKNLLIKPPYYSRNEFENIISALPLGYDTKLEDLVNIGFLLRNNRRFLEALE